MKFSLLTLATAAAVATAQGLSGGCQGQLLSLAFGDLGNCLQITQILSVLSAGNNVIGPLNNYLNALCASSTPRCSNQTLSSANQTIISNCQSDLSSGGSAADTVRALQSILNSYPQVYAGGCSKNSTTGNFCVTDTLTAVQNATGQTITINTVTSLLSGSESGLSNLNSALTGGQLCTGCVSGLYQQAVAANSTISTLPVAQSIVSRCGSGFGGNASGVSQAPSSGASGASGGASASNMATSSAAATSSRAAGITSFSPTFSLPAVAAVVSVLGGMVAGGMAVL